MSPRRLIKQLGHYVMKALPAVAMTMLVTQAKAAKTELTWTPSPSASIVAQKVYQAGADGVFTNVTVIPGNATNWVVGGLAPGQTYTYAVTALTSSGQESAKSNFSSYVPSITPPAITGAEITPQITGPSGILQPGVLHLHVQPNDPPTNYVGLITTQIADQNGNPIVSGSGLCVTNGSGANPHDMTVMPSAGNFTVPAGTYTIKANSYYQPLGQNSVYSGYYTSTVPNINYFAPTPPSITSIAPQSAINGGSGNMLVYLDLKMSNNPVGNIYVGLNASNTITHQVITQGSGSFAQGVQMPVHMGFNTPLPAGPYVVWASSYNDVLKSNSAWSAPANATVGNTVASTPATLNIHKQDGKEIISARLTAPPTNGYPQSFEFQSSTNLGTGTWSTISRWNYPTSGFPCYLYYTNLSQGKGFIRGLSQ